MGIVIFAENAFEDAASITTTNALAANPVTRLYDRDRGPQCVATGAGQWDIKGQWAAARSASHVALINHNIAVAGCTVATSPDDISYTTRATFTPTGVDPVFVNLLAAYSDLYWRIRIPAFGSAPQVGEVLLGTARQIQTAPAYSPAVRQGRVGNVVRMESPGGYAWRAQRGSVRIRYEYAWNLMPSAGPDDLTEATTAFSQSLQGARSVLVQHADGATWVWMEFDGPPRIEWDHVHTNRVAMKLAFLEAL